jgi:hypothetical protein
MTKAKSKHTKSKTIAKRHSKSRKEKPTIAENPDCPYRPGTLYGTLFTEGNRDYITKEELIKRVAELTGKSEKVVNFAFQVLKSPSHRSNKKRSTIIEENGKVKLIANK